MGYFPGLDDENEEDMTPVSSIAGPATTRDQVMQRISEVRNPSQADSTQGGYDSSAAIDFARQSAQTAGMGRALNALAAGTGFKADNSSYDTMEKQGTDVAEKAMNREALVKKAIEDRRSKEALAGAMGKMKDRAQSETERHNRAMESLAAKNSEVRLAKNRDAEMLPMEDAELVKDLAKKNASKIAISNQIDAVIKNWDSLPDDQKVAQGRQLIKVLNSTEGADAVGTEEAKRLGGKLEFALGNLFNDNPMQFGRDLEGFKEQALGTVAGIRSAIRENQIAQNEAYRRAGVGRQDPDAVPSAKYRKAAPSGDMIESAHASAPQIAPQDLEALKWAKANPKDPRAAGILQRLQAKGLR